MVKFKSFLKVYLQTFIYYRLQAFVWAVVDVMPLVVLIFIWQAIYQNQSLVAGLNFSQMVSYYFLLTLIFQLIYTAGGKNTISLEIYNGQLVFFLLKPYLYLKRVLAEEISWRSIQFLLFLPLFFLLMFLVKDNINLSLNYLSWLWFFLSLALAFFISAFLDYVCGLTAFWLVQTITLFHLKEICYWIFGGLAFPQSLLPAWLQKLNLFLPFYYVFAFPLEIITRDFYFQEIALRFAVQFVWLMVLFLVYKYLWKKGLKAYEAWGN